MLTVVDLIVSDNRAAICPDLYPSQGISIDVVSFNETSAITKNIHSTLVAIEYSISPAVKHHISA